MMILHLQIKIKDYLYLKKIDLKKINMKLMSQDQENIILIVIKKNLIYIILYQKNQIG